jgi:hypothetical protein
LKIFVINPADISIRSVDRIFLTLQSLKTYLRNSTSENRLRLALSNIHRNIFITDDMVLDKFANSGRAKRLKLIT